MWRMVGDGAARRAALALSLRRHRGRRAVAGLALACGLVSAAAQGSGAPDTLDSRYFHRTWRHGNGLPGGSVNAIAQTADGYLWVGTEDGLARFDGWHFTTYGERPKGVFRSRFVAALAAGRDGSLWIGTERGLLRMRRGEVIRDGAAGSLLADASVNALAEDAGGDLWVGTRSGLLRRSATSGKVTGAWLRGLVVTKLLAGEAGEVWIGTDNDGAWRLRAGKLAPLGGDPRLAQLPVTGLLRDQDGSILVFTGMASGRFLPGQNVTTAPAPPPQIEHVVAAATADGSLWLATTDRGIMQVVTTLDGKHEYTENSPARAQVHTMFVAADHTIWYGAAGAGLHQLMAKRCQTYTERDGLPEGFPTSVLYEPGGVVWVGATGGLTRLVRGFKSGLSDWSAHPELSGILVLSLLRDSHGTLWAGTSRGVARRLNGRWVFLPPWGRPATLSVSWLLEDSAGRLWVGTAGGLGVMAEDLRRVLPVRGLEDREITALAEDAASALWIGTRGAGLLRLLGRRVQTLRTADEMPFVSTILRGVANDGSRA